MRSVPFSRFVIASLGGLFAAVLAFFDITLLGGPNGVARIAAWAGAVLFGLFILRGATTSKALQRAAGLAALGFLIPIPAIVMELKRARVPGAKVMPAGDVGEGMVGVFFFLGAGISCLAFLLFTVIASARKDTPPAEAQPAAPDAPVED